MHISEVHAAKRTAAKLANANLDNDEYHQTIKAAARALNGANYGLARYGGHYASGTTWWTHGSQSLSVRRDGQIIDTTSY